MTNKETEFDLLKAEYIKLNAEKQKVILQMNEILEKMRNNLKDRGASNEQKCLDGRFYVISSNNVEDLFMIDGSLKAYKNSKSLDSNAHG